MITKLNNGTVTIEVNSIGAELSSLVRNGEGYEYIWQGDPAFWTGRSPVLYPVVGGCVDDKIVVDGKTYEMPKHGYARRREFQLVKQDDEQLVYSLKYNDEILGFFPYKTELKMTYALEGSTVVIEYEVVNLDEMAVYFQLGTHPAFNCPMSEGLEFSDYYLEFNHSEDAVLLSLNEEGLFVDETAKNIEEARFAGNKHELKHDMFYNDALVYTNINSDTVTLKTDKDEKFVKVHFENLPHIGIWQKMDAPYLCIEPWHGHADYADFSGEMKDKELAVELEVGQSFKSRLAVTV